MDIASTSTIEEDLRPQWMQAIILEISATAVVDHLLASTFFYIQTSMTMNENNKFVLYVILGDQSFLLSPLDNDAEILKKGQFASYRATILQRLEMWCKQLSGPTKLESNPIPMTKLIAGILMRLMCYIKARENEQPRLKGNSRALVIRTSIKDTDSALQPYLVNAIFAAKKMGVNIDSAIINERKNDSLYLQQAAYLTGGLYIKIAKVEALQQVLLQCFIGDNETRKLFKMPNNLSVELGTICTCCNTKVNAAYICSQCLAAFCQSDKAVQEGKCRYCGARFCIDL